MNWYAYPNRTLCDTLEEMRKIITIEHGSGATLMSLVEEAQCYANRMEGAMEDWSDVRRGHEKKNELKEQIKRLEKDIKQLEEKKGNKDE